MEVIIEVGTDEQKILIAKELELLGMIIGNFNPPLNLTRFIIPDDFDGKVKEIENISRYQSKRGLERNEVTALAKISPDGNGYAILVSPLLYTTFFDTQIRYFIFLHELSHIINRNDFPKIDKDSPSKHLYLQTLYYLFDEYYADRKAYELVDMIYPEKSEFWNNYIQIEFDSYLKSINGLEYYEALVGEINAFRQHGNITLFLDRITPQVDIVAPLLVHTFARFHAYPEKMSERELLKSKFVNQKTINLMDYFREHYHSDPKELAHGYGLVEEFLTNFGVRYNDEGEDIYCTVLDI